MSLYDSEGHEAKNDATLHAQKVVTVCLDANGVERQAGVDEYGQVLVKTALTSGEDQTNDVVVAELGRFTYETVAASQTAQVLGAFGTAGDFLHSIIITASTGTITILDGAITVAVIPAGALGVWPFNVVSASGAWNITTAADTECTAVGRFTA